MVVLMSPCSSEAVTSSDGVRIIVDRRDELVRRRFKTRCTVQLHADDLVGDHDHRIGRSAEVALFELDSRSATFDARQGETNRTRT